jgi:hypothetical protein
MRSDAGATDSGFPSGRERLGSFNVRKLGWYAVSALVAALILGGVLLLGANLYVQSLAVQHRIRQTLAATLQMPVSLRKTTITPWDGLRIDGIVARLGPDRTAAQTARPDFLEAESFRIRFALLPLFAGRFTVTEVLLDHPRLAWPQDAQGRWQFPPALANARPKKPKHAPALVPSAPPAAAPVPGAVPAISQAPPRPEIAPPGESSPPLPRPDEVLALGVDRLRLRHGALELLDAQDGLISRFDDVNIDGRLPDSAHASGEYWFAQAGFPRTDLVLANFHGCFTYVRDRDLDLSDGKGELAGGHLLLTYHLALDTPGSPYAAECQIENASIAKLFAQAGSETLPISGRLEGNLSISGLSGDAASRQAEGHFQVLNTQVKNLPLLQAFGQALHIHDLTQLTFDRAELDCQLHGSTLELGRLRLASRDLEISIHGEYLTDEDRLDLHARLVIDAAVGHQLPQFIEANFTPIGNDAPGARFIDFTITGPLEKPSTDLFDRALSGPLAGIFQNLLNTTPRRPKKPKLGAPDKLVLPPPDPAEGKGP